MCVRSCPHSVRARFPFDSGGFGPLRGGYSMLDLAVSFCTDLVSACMPFWCVFGLTGIALKIFMSAAFKGRVEI